MWNERGKPRLSRRRDNVIMFLFSPAQFVGKGKGVELNKDSLGSKESKSKKRILNMSRKKWWKASSAGKAEASTRRCRSE